MELKSIKLQNFRKFDQFSIDFTGAKNEVRRPNRWGKSTIADAIAFVLVGKLNNGSSDLSSIKPIQNGFLEPAEKLETVAELVFLNGKNDGPMEIMLRKEYGEQWVKTRGTTDYEMKGHYTNLYVNGQKKTATEYTEMILGLFRLPSTEYLNILTNPTFFSQGLSWQRRLEILTELVGDVDADEVFKANTMLKDIKPELDQAFGDADQAIKTLKYKLDDGKTNGLKRRAADLEAQINGFVINDPVSEDTFTAAAQKITSNTTKIVELRVKKTGLKDPVIESLNQQLLEAKALLSKSEATDREELLKKNQTINDQINSLREKAQAESQAAAEVGKKAAKIELDIHSLQNQIHLKNTQITDKEARKEQKKKDWYTERDKLFTPLESVLCPNCGADINEQANQSALDRFNAEKAEKMKNITAEGQELKADIEALQKEIQSLNDQIAEAEKNKASIIIPKAMNYDAEIASLSSQKTYYYESEATKKVKERIGGIEKNIEEEKNRGIDDGGLTNDIMKLEEENANLQETIIKYQVEKKNREQRREWENQLATVNRDIANIEVKIDLLKEYRRTKIDIFKAKLGQAFGGIEFQLIEENIKADSWDQTCYVVDRTPNGIVKYEYTNTERKIKIGIQIIEAIKGLLNCEILPIIIDNAEAITDMNRNFDTTAQTICFIAKDTAPATTAGA